MRLPSLAAALLLALAAAALTPHWVHADEFGPHPLLQRYQIANDAYRAAQGEDPGPARTAHMRQAAELYRAALDEAPQSHLAPEAAFMGAAAFSEAGDLAGALAILSVFVRGYGDAALLETLKNGDKKVSPPIPADPKQLAERTRFLATAYQQIASDQLATFDLRGAAATFAEAADNAWLETSARRDFAWNAVRLAYAFGELPLLKTAHEKLVQLKPTPEALAEADYLLAAQESADDDSDEPLSQYYKTNHKSAAAGPFIVRAAARLADRQAKLADRTTWCDKAVSAFDKLGAEGKTNAELLELAAGCAYRNLDLEISQKFAPLDGQRSYPKQASELIKAFEEDLKSVGVWVEKLERFQAAYPSTVFAAIAWAREASLFDACQKGLDARPVQYNSEADERLLNRVDVAGDDRVLNEARARQAKQREEWRANRERLVAASVPQAVKRYARAVLTGRAASPEHPAILHSLGRLAYFTSRLGNGEMGSIPKEPDFGYHDDAYLLVWPTKLLPRAEECLPDPLPAVLER
ncbi:MAG: hypothetical protein U0271_05850 [Polyangiaceae bacterium]